MKTIINISWGVLGLLQFAAMLSSLDDKLGIILGTIVAFILGQIPIIGTILGMRGAIMNWNVLQAIGLFCGVPIILIGIPIVLRIFMELHFKARARPLTK